MAGQEFNLLVVDWDFFFPNPVYGADVDEYFLLYDWTHREAPYYIDMAWAERAAGFLAYGLPLPVCRGYQGFWDRFRLADAAPLMYADSNLYAGLLTPRSFGGEADAWSVVSLWDAHHDCGYRGTLETWRASGQVHCDTWMLVHHDRGSDLEVVYPSWRTGIDGIEKGPLIPVRRRIDDGTNPARTYDAVYLSRSGAWVPAWVDRQFEEFLAEYPGPRLEMPGNEWTQPRPDPLPAARQRVAMRRRSGDLPGWPPGDA